MKFPLVENWKQILLKAQSLRWTLVAGLFGGFEMLLPAFMDVIPRGRFAAAAMLACIGSMLARVKAQPEMHDGK